MHNTRPRCTLRGSGNQPPTSDTSNTSTLVNRTEQQPDPRESASARVHRLRSLYFFAYSRGDGHVENLVVAHRVGNSVFLANRAKRGRRERSLRFMPGNYNLGEREPLLSETYRSKSESQYLYPHGRLDYFFPVKVIRLFPVTDDRSIIGLATDPDFYARARRSLISNARTSVPTERQMTRAIKSRGYKLQLPIYAAAVQRRRSDTLSLALSRLSKEIEARARIFVASNRPDHRQIRIGIEIYRPS